MLSRFLFAVMLIVCLTGFRPQAPYSDYCNVRFSFCIQYPKGFTAPKESTNSDGAVMLSRDRKTEVRAYGSLVDKEVADLTQTFRWDSDSVTVTYQAKLANGFIFSGTDKHNNIVYEKTVQKRIDYFGGGMTDVYQTWRITYPASQSAVYGGYCAVIGKGL